MKTARQRPITLVLAVLMFFQGVRFIRTNLWFGVASLILSALLVVSYFSTRVQKFVDRNRTTGGILLLAIYVFLGTFFYVNGNIQFAIATGFVVLILGGLLLLDIWAERTYPDYER